MTPKRLPPPRLAASWTLIAAFRAYLTNHNQNLRVSVRRSPTTRTLATMIKCKDTLGALHLFPKSNATFWLPFLGSWKAEQFLPILKSSQDSLQQYLASLFLSVSRAFLHLFSLFFQERHH